MKIEALGEFELIGELAGLVPPGSSVVRGIGDDAAVLDPGGEAYLLVAADACQEGVHFRRQDGPERIGRKALAVNLSDLAAMGGRPRWALVCAGFPSDLPLDFARSLYRGMGKLAAATGTGIVGGDTWRSPGGIVLSVTVVGEVAKSHCLFRDGASPGEAICLTGSLGEAARGKHLDFTPRLEAGRLLGEKFGVTAAIDLSDGLFADLGQLCRLSGVGARLEASDLPLAPAAAALAGPARLAAAGQGEEFELAFTVPEEKLPRLLVEFPGEASVTVTRIGLTLPAREGLSLWEKDKKLSWPAVGYDHFKV